MVRAWAGRLLFLAALALGGAPGIAAAQGAPDFGAPPSGQYPILFNDHHVYAKPDTDKKGRVLSALVRGKTILVPLRSMFEQMGAEVSYDPTSRTAVVSKPGSEIRVTVGKAEVVINGETRPLDVPPEMYEGNVLVPIRVISEAMGAYVQWVAEKRAVVVRYIPLAAPPAPPAPPPPPPAATPVPQQSYTPTTFATPAPEPTVYHEKFIVADVIGWPRIDNEFAFGTQSRPSYNVRAAVEMASPVIHWMIEGNLSAWNFAAPGGGVNTFGGTASTIYPGFNGWDNIADVDVGMKIMYPRVYFIEGFAWAWNNWGYPTMDGLGFGLDKIPDFDKSSSWEARWWYSQRQKGTYNTFTTTGGTVIPGGTLAYRVQKWMLGYEWTASPHIYWELGVQGQHYSPSISAPSGRNEVGAFVGIGGKF